MSFPLSHLLSLILPSCTLLFLLTGPHEFAIALAWTLPLFGILLADWLSPTIKTLQQSYKPKWYFDSLLYSLAILQLTNVFLMLVLVSRLNWDSTVSILTSLAHLLVIRFLVGTSSCCSGIIVAHEFIHRSKRWQRILGRFLLLSVCYDHFFIAHTQGHHKNVGKPQDVTTAQRGESFKHYWRRVAIEQFIYAWQFEKNRINSNLRINYGLRLLNNRVIQGLALEFIMLVIIITFFGGLAAVLFTYQAYVAVRQLEAVNYFQHWGLQHGEADNPTAWVNNGWFTHQIFLGLPLHICHHQNATKPFYKLVHNDNGPVMPYGYLVMNLWVKLNNASFTKKAEQQIEAYITQNNLTQNYRNSN